MNHLYYRLAVTNLKNNRQFYLPYLLAGIVSAMMFYIMRAVQGNDSISQMRGASVLRTVLFMGVVIVGACVCIFLFYTNSFVMKRRKKELGVYNILGMEKRHIAKVLAWEAVILYAVSVCGGLVCGIVFNKLVTMFLCRLTGLSESIPFYISGWGCLQTAELFAAAYAVMLFYNFIQVKLANPIALLHGNNVGEREPKAKWISAGIGIACILTGYYLAVHANGILEAVNMFFAAVVLVIVGTYELFLSVSIAVLKLMKKNKKYYYKTSHFITVSGMIYRMKRNAVGLANICVLSTMVLVILSTTVCLYAGVEDSLQNSYPEEVSAAFYLNDVPGDTDREYLLQQFIEVAEKQNREVTEVSAYSDAVYVIHNAGNEVELFDNESYNFTEMGMLFVMTKGDYEQYTGQALDEIAQGSVIVISLEAFSEDIIKVFDKEYPVAGRFELPEDFPNREPEELMGDINVIYLIVADDSAMKDFDGEIRYHVGVETDGTQEERKEYASAVREAVEACRAQSDFDRCLIDSRAEQREEYLGMNGGFLFLGLFLGILFLMITVLIIYYKQISEGFEDRERFAILTKVGMSRDMVKAAINAQVRTVFFLPITVAVIHLVMAFPILKLMLMLFGLANNLLFVGCLAVTAAVFAVIYFIVFKLTSRSYYNIVY
ncbi:MAG: ABC transporter permease [Lachnospiraceae bacterium]|nr:ABC transporter permease [Lachnospiraceae bacterium]MDE7271994.1 ABC transporter permease [Lachnospiraceae bacterium]